MNNYWISFALFTVISAAQADLAQEQVMAKRPVLKAALLELVVKAQACIGALQSGQ